MPDESLDLDIYAAVFDASGDAIIIQDGVRFLDCNAAAVELLRYPSKAALLRAHPADFSPTLQPEGGESRTLAAEHIALAVERGTHRFDWMHRDRDGREFYCEVWLATFDWRGRRLIRATIRDISERKEAERQAAEINRAYFKSLFDSTPQGIVILDNHDLIVDVNPGFEELFQHSRDDLVGCDLHECIVPEYLREEAASLSQRALSGATDALEETVRMRKDGSEVHVSILGAPVLLDNLRLGVCGIYRDMTPQWEAREQLRQSEERLRAVVGSLPVVLFTLDRKGVFTMSEGLGLKALGQTPARAVGKTLLDLYPDQPQLYAAFQAALDGESQTVTHEQAHAAFEAQFSPLTDAAGDVTGVLGLARDVTETREIKRRLEHMAHHDVLTGLPNRALFRDRVEAAMRRARRKRLPFAMLFVDLDRFKTINDSLGHAIGDRVLRTVAARFTDVLRASDTVARLGGDEFAVLVEEVDSPHGAAVVAQKLLEALAKPIPEEDLQLSTSASVGISLYPNDGADADTLLRNADAAMYDAKQTRNNYQFFSAEMNESALESLMLSNNMRLALDRGEFLLHYQPLIDLHSNAITGCEALVRWNHPERGLVPPMEFIPIAEETGLITPLGEWVIGAACRQARAWLDEGHRNLRMAVNLSAKQFRNWHFVD
ncbi:MAG TPA: diguanylate cyclase, partial [Gammaproteobacteria bacterium]|nr:diguanylate cyclase [Gammaproteobacteria bacterium]